MDITEQAQKVTKGNRTFGIIIAILMAILGILLLCIPARTMAWVEYLAVVGFAIFGIFQIVKYIRMPANAKQGWTLACGIINVIVGVMLLFARPYVIGTTIAFMLGILSMMTGISKCSAYAALRKDQAPGAGWMLFSGILDILVSIFFICSPFAMTFAFAIILGIYLIVGGISLFAESCSSH